MLNPEPKHWKDGAGPSVFFSSFARDVRFKPGISDVCNHAGTAGAGRNRGEMPVPVRERRQKFQIEFNGTRVAGTGRQWTNKGRLNRDSIFFSQIDAFQFTLTCPVRIADV